MGPDPGDQEFTGTVQTGSSAPLVLKFLGRARRRPAISPNGVVNAATGQEGPGLAPGSSISIWGTALSESTVSFDSIFPPGLPVYLPIALGGVSVSFDVPSQDLSYPGRLTYVSPSQINAQIPWELSGAASALLKVRIGDAISEVYQVSLSASAPGVFEAPAGSGQAAARDSLTGAAITAEQPAREGQWITIYANGLGPVDNTPQSGEMTPIWPLARCRSTPSVTIGGKSATVDFAGLTPTGAGYYQINLKVPHSPSGNQPVSVSIDGVTARTVFLSTK
jgi:uncharacterized protein (TIGR03437 family)